MLGTTSCPCQQGMDFERDLSEDHYPRTLFSVPCWFLGELFLTSKWHPLNRFGFPTSTTQDMAPLCHFSGCWNWHGSLHVPCKQATTNLWPCLFSGDPPPTKKNKKETHERHKTIEVVFLPVFLQHHKAQVIPKWHVRWVMFDPPNTGNTRTPGGSLILHGPPPGRVQTQRGTQRSFPS